MTLAFAAERCCWPDQAAARLALALADPLEAAVLHGRLQQWQPMEALLLAALPSLEAERADLARELLCGLRLRRDHHAAAVALLQASPRAADPSHQGWWLRRGQLALQQGQAQQLLQEPPPPASHPLLGWLQVQALIISGALQEARHLADALAQAGPSFPEALQIHAQLCWLEGQPEQALKLLEQLLGRCSGEEGVWGLAVQLLRPKPEQRRLHLAQALSRFPASTALRTARVEDDLQGRRSCRARRDALLARLHGGVDTAALVSANQHASDANLLTSYEHTARADLLLRSDPSLQRRLLANAQALANQALQLASLQAPTYPSVVRALASQLPAPDPLPARRRGSRSLRVGLVSPDLRYHPVGRFLYMALRAGLATGGELHLIDTSRNPDGVSPPIATFAREAAIPLHRLGALPSAEQLARVRHLELDVALDLAGWSSENAGALFAARIAPLQINYLGFFASSGLPAMDGWLGDAQLFPMPMREWHSERILRLPRCFLAWQPVPDLFEGQVAVPAPRPAAAPIHFGSFNHARKLSAATLRLWGRILTTVPGSRLVLKSFTSDDPGVVTLLRRRMVHCGLDPERVVWLPTCPSPLDHLRQYGLLDVALDPFPNGGCTTTCEALWMGVPVITLAGDHYASRMATAVLHGAGQQGWVAASEAGYLQLAVQAADRLSQLRAGREHLRRQLQASPLGDGAGFSRAFWQLLESEALP